MGRTTTSRTATTRTTTPHPRAVAVAAALLLTAGATGAAVASADGGTHAVTAAKKAQQREAAALTGSAKMYRKTTEDVTFTFDAHLAARHIKDPSKATGTFHFVHLDRPGGEGGWAKGRIDCLMTGGKVATATGIITESSFKEMKGKRVGFTVDDRGRNDRVGYSWAAYGATQGQPDTLAKCASSAPYEKVRKGTGDFDVVPWKVPYPEPQGS
ncbi:Repetin [Streptomyces venezuelae]|uniref:Repetin n=1 Tax=Streptomyces venezuelae TaxID=54571 RepID=A0A5P2CCJ7_STRVZ|nr:Repetin [Streptomyces venezuelae]QES40452.1 Repetin [Streptomyces venezuelae]